MFLHGNRNTSQIILYIFAAKHRATIPLIHKIPLTHNPDLFL
ncbi:MAG: hypothetical protein ACFB02_03470 [Mastigocoleus sp.]